MKTAPPNNHPRCGALSRPRKAAGLARSSRGYARASVPQRTSLSASARVAEYGSARSSRLHSPMGIATSAVVPASAGPRQRPGSAYGIKVGRELRGNWSPGPERDPEHRRTLRRRQRSAEPGLPAGHRRSEHVSQQSVPAAQAFPIERGLHPRQPLSGVLEHGSKHRGRSRSPPLNLPLRPALSDGLGHSSLSPDRGLTRFPGGCRAERRHDRGYVCQGAPAAQGEPILGLRAWESTLHPPCGAPARLPIGRGEAGRPGNRRAPGGSE